MKEILSRLLPHNWNDMLAVMLLIIIPLLWILAGSGRIDLTKLGDLNGALIATWTLIIQFYFRRAPPGNGGTPPAPGGNP